MDRILIMKKMATGLHLPFLVLFSIIFKHVISIYSRSLLQYHLYSIRGMLDFSKSLHFNNQQQNVGTR